MNDFYNELEKLANEYPFFVKDGARFLIDCYLDNCTNEEEKELYTCLSDLLYSLANGDDLDTPLYYLSYKGSRLAECLDK